MIVLGLFPGLKSGSVGVGLKELQKFSHFTDFPFPLFFGRSSLAGWSEHTVEGEPSLTFQPAQDQLVSVLHSKDPLNNFPPLIPLREGRKPIFLGRQTFCC